MSFVTPILKALEPPVVNYGYVAAGVAGLYRISFPGGEPALVPWVGLVGGIVVLSEAPEVGSYSTALVGLGAGVFIADIMGSSLVFGGLLGAVAGYTLLTNPVSS